MSFRVGWDYPALASFSHIPWPTSADVDAAVQSFARERAPVVPSGRRWIRVAGYTVVVRVDRKRDTVLVEYLYRDR
jgi:hypothetical protein